MTTIGLRIDVDTFSGTRDGVPRLLDTLARHDVRGTFYFCLGPDNMGRHAWRLLRPRFLLKMLRSNAPGLYGWEVIFAGTAWPGRQIGRRLGAVIRAAEAAGHEVGLHAWDHERWQRRAARMDEAALYRELARGAEALGEILGHAPTTSAAAGWICTDAALAAKERLGFRFNSDCRGTNVFVPIVAGRRLAPQVPTTMPTYDEIIGRDGVTDANYNERLLGFLRPGKLNVLTIHAEVEGVSRADLFDDFLSLSRARGLSFARLGDLPELVQPAATDTLALGPLAGRDGDLAWQHSALAHAATQ